MGMFDRKKERKENIWHIQVDTDKKQLDTSSYLNEMDRTLEMVEEEQAVFLSLNAPVPVSGISFLRVSLSDDKYHLIIEAGTGQKDMFGNPTIFYNDNMFSSEISEILEDFYNGNAPDLSEWKQL